jgi:hypothetical protein
VELLDGLRLGLFLIGAATSGFARKSPNIAGTTTSLLSCFHIAAEVESSISYIANQMRDRRIRTSRLGSFERESDNPGHGATPRVTDHES